MTSRRELEEWIDPYGLSLLGDFPVQVADQVPEVAAGRPAAQLVMIGNGGSSFWEVFRQSPEYLDGQPDPLDRWSERLGRALADHLGGRAIFPWQGPPYAPFSRWAQRTGQAFQSPVSMLIHTQYGLWHAYRFALALTDPLEGPQAASTPESPCLGCAGKPCLQACPVQAFSPGAYRVDDCVAHLSAEGRDTCAGQGCIARRACPAGQEFRYLPGHARYHMDAFLQSRKIDS
jgi:ferredoxin